MSTLNNSASDRDDLIAAYNLFLTRGLHNGPKHETKLARFPNHRFINRNTYKIMILD